MRFGSSTIEQKQRTGPRERWRLWMLFGSACVVLWFMRMLQQPATVNRIDSFFSPATEKKLNDQSQGNVDANQTEEIFLETPAVVAFKEQGLVAVDRPKPFAEIDLSAIKDNTFFRAEENPAWFGILEQLQHAPLDALQRDSLGEVTYAQLVKQPDVYRGKPVSIQGTVMREELLDAPANDLGIENYHRLVIRPAGGGVWPMVVYSLELPDQFPRGDKIRADVRVTGIFFKNWSYSWQEGLGLAPVILAKTVGWQPTHATRPTQTSISLSGVVGVIATASALAAFVGWLAWRQTQRPTMPTSHRDVVISLPAEPSEAES